MQTLNRIATFMAVVGLSLFSTNGFAQSSPPFECDDNFGQCGTPQQSGGGGGGGGGGSILINNTDLGDTYQYADDYDDDGIEDPFDNCPFTANRDQADEDGDQIGTGCDNCPLVQNNSQADLDGDGLGDACDDDRDGDQVPNGLDSCPDNPNPIGDDGLQKDTDGDDLGDACDGDMDGDGVANLQDNCPLIPNADQSDAIPGSAGDACDDDDDGDDIRNTFDNCPQIANPDQSDVDLDGMGDACDPDQDNDTIVNAQDNCPLVANADQEDLDRDSVGDACDDAYCYVVMGDDGDCLDPLASFKVYSPEQDADVGEEVFLRLFTNRVNEPVRYVWSVLEAPNSSNATVLNPTGAASISTPYEYHYLEDQRVVFTPDVPGTYKIKVVAELVWQDEVTGQDNVAAENIMELHALGDALSGTGCQSFPASPMSGMFSMILMFLGLWFTRKIK